VSFDKLYGLYPVAGFSYKIAHAFLPGGRGPDRQLPGYPVEAGEFVAIGGLSGTGNIWACQR